MLGYALSHAIGNPMTTRLITQLLVFVVMGFSPIMYPASQLPDWLAAVTAGCRSSTWPRSCEGG